MSIIIYKCDWTKQYIAYDEDYADEFTPHGRGVTETEAVEDLKDTMDCYFGSLERFNLWMSELPGKEIDND